MTSRKLEDIDVGRFSRSFEPFSIRQAKWVWEAPKRPPSELSLFVEVSGLMGYIIMLYRRSTKIDLRAKPKKLNQSILALLTVQVC